MCAFTERMGGLTVLDSHSGRAILRTQLTNEFGYVRELRKSPAGILLIGYERVSLADPETLRCHWTIEKCSDAVVEGTYLVAHDGYHTVRCYDTVSGKERWSRDIEG